MYTADDDSSMTIKTNKFFNIQNWWIFNDKRVHFFQWLLSLTQFGTFYVNGIQHWKLVKLLFIKIVLKRQWSF